MFIAPGFAEVTVKFRQAAGYRIAMSSWGFGIAGWDEDVNAIAGRWEVAWAAFGMPINSYAAGVVVKVGTSDPSAPLVYETTLETPGSGSAQLMSPLNSAIVTKRTLLGGRKGRGRAYLFPVREGDVNSLGVYDSGYLSSVEGHVETWLNDTAELLGGAEPLGYLLHTDAVTPATAIQSIRLEALTSHQSRRQPRS